MQIPKTYSPIEKTVAQYYFNLLQNTVKSNNHPLDKIVDIGLLLHSVLKRLTKDQLQLFGSDYERVIVIIDQYAIPEAQANDLKKLWHFVDKVGKAKIREVTSSQLQKAVYRLAQTIWLFSGGETIPTDISDFYQKIVDQKEAEEELYTVVEKIPLFQGVILGKSEKTETRDGKPYFQLHCVSDVYGEVSIYCWKDFLYIHPLVWKYARINITNLNITSFKFGEKESERTSYVTSNSTLIALDPDFLIDASNIVSCCVKKGTNPLMYLAKKFQATTTNYYLMRGSIVNYYLDANVCNEDPPLKSLFEEFVQARPAYALTFNNNDYRRLRTETIKHFNTIKNQHVQQLKKHSLTIEPTFLSEKFGLRGRLDVMVEYEDQPDKKDVIELKTSKDPKQWDRQVNESDALQAITYHLLLDSLNEKHSGTSAILYSSVGGGENPFRNVPTDVKNKRKVLSIRNTIVAYEYRLSLDPKIILSRIQLRYFHRNYLWDNEKALIESIRSSIAEAKLLEQDYFYAFIRFIAREQRATKLGSHSEQQVEGFAALWNRDRAFKERNFSVLAGLQYEEMREEVNGIYVHFTKTDTSITTTRYRTGDFVLLYPQEADGSLRPTKHQVLKANIKKLTKTEVVLSPINKHITDNYFKQYSLWSIEAESSEMGFGVMYQSLFRFLNLPQDRKDLLLGFRAPRFGAFQAVEAPILKPKQQELIQRALAAKDYFLLQGPPGTGKTKVMLREIIVQLLKNPAEKLVLLGFTNRSVDEICEAVKSIESLQFPEFFRLGYGSSTEHPDILLSRYAKQNSLKTLKQVIHDCRIFIATVQTYQRSAELRYFLEIDKAPRPDQPHQKLTAIIDEASQLLEPQLVGILGKVDRFMLIGDDKQLPAVVIQREEHLKSESENLQQIGIERLSDSLFERLVRRCKQEGWANAFGMLEDQGRMHEVIAEFPNQVYYDGELKSITERQRIPIPDYLLDNNAHQEHAIYEILRAKRSIFLTSEPENERNRNLQEAQAVRKLVDQLLPLFSPDEMESAIGIITPYRTQIAAIREALDDQLHKDITVDTVERYQGGQKRIIIVSFAVNSVAQLQNLHVLNTEGNVDKKLNVTLTRAKDHLILIGAAVILHHSPIYKALLDFYYERDLVYKCEI